MDRKIISYPRNDQRWVKVVHCTCGAAYEITRDDLFVAKTGGNTVPMVSSVITNCVFCKKPIIVQNQNTNDWGIELPQGVYQEPESEIPE